MYTFFIFLLLLILLPVFAVIGISILCFSGRPVFYLQRRIGKDGVPFVMYKFRTMYQRAEQDQKKYRTQNEASGPVFKIHNDPRFTPIGRFLSHTGLDELPQLWNVFLGDMALFGPRPLPIAEAKQLLSWQKERQKIKPGIVSPWIFNGYHQRTFDEWMRDDCVYVQKKSFVYDTHLFALSCVFVARLFVREVFFRRDT